MTEKNIVKAKSQYPSATHTRIYVVKINEKENKRNFYATTVQGQSSQSDLATLTTELRITSNPNNKAIRIALQDQTFNL